MKRIWLFILLLLLSTDMYSQYNAVCFYVVAQQDEWQLFMGLNVFNDIAQNNAKENKKVVIIYTTAGHENNNGQPMNAQYYTARQAGADHCVEFCADQQGSHGVWDSTVDTINGHALLRRQYKNVTSYCLRLPGAPDAAQECDIKHLHDGTVSGITDIERSTNYTSWKDLVNTLRSIINVEDSAIPQVILNTADTDVILNKNCRIDNVYTSRLALDAFAQTGHMELNLFREFCITGLPANLEDKDISTKAALLSLMDYGLTENGQASEWTADNINFLSRHYFRTVKK